MGIPVHVAPDEVPEVDDSTVKLLTVARRLGLRIGTCSSAVVDEALRWELPVVDLRGVAQALSPDHLPGEELRLELIKEGRQPRQAIGYLPDGDMVVVNDATHLIGGDPVRVSVLSTRPTSRGSSSSPNWPPKTSRSSNLSTPCTDGLRSRPPDPPEDPSRALSSGWLQQAHRVSYPPPTRRRSPRKRRPPRWRW